MFIRFERIHERDDTETDRKTPHDDIGRGAKTAKNIIFDQ